MNKEDRTKKIRFKRYGSSKRYQGAIKQVCDTATFADPIFQRHLIKKTQDKWVKTAQFFTVFGVVLLYLGILLAGWPIGFNILACGAFSLVVACGIMIEVEHSKLIRA